MTSQIEQTPQSPVTNHVIPDASPTTTATMPKSPLRFDLITRIGVGVSLGMTSVTALVGFLTRTKRKSFWFGLLNGSLNAFTNTLWQYWFTVRPGMLRWGATKEEWRAELPGDRFVPNPRYIATRAVTINAPPERVWQWLVQMGQGRGGLYSYEWLENLAGCDIHNVTEIVPEYQNLKVGDKIRLYPEKPEQQADLAFNVVLLEPAKLLLLQTPGDLEANLKTAYPFMTWAFVLQPQAEGVTRLVIRTRSDYRPDFKGVLFNQLLLEPVHFFMERKMAKTIKRLAETHR